MTQDRMQAPHVPSQQGRTAIVPSAGCGPADGVARPDGRRGILRSGLLLVAPCFGVPACAGVSGPDGQAGGMPARAIAAAPYRRGDRAAYAVWNANGERWVYRAELRDAKTGYLLTVAPSMDPWSDSGRGWNGWGRVFFPDNGVKVPEAVTVTWWFDAEAAQRGDLTQREGPYTVPLRRRISARALASAAEVRYQSTLLEIGVSAGVVPPVLRWHLNGWRAGILERGGDEVTWRAVDWR